MKKPVRLLIYAGIIAFAWFILSPALTINTAKIGAPLRELFSQINGYALAAVVAALAFFITYIITSGWGLFVLGAIALCALLVVSIMHPYLFPLLTPLFAVWIFCAMARRGPKEKAATSG